MGTIKAVKGFIYSGELMFFQVRGCEDMGTIRAVKGFIYSGECIGIINCPCI